MAPSYETKMKELASRANAESLEFLGKFLSNDKGKLADLQKACHYNGFDLEKIWNSIYETGITQDMYLRVQFIVFARGCSKAKILKNWQNDTEAKTYQDIVARLFTDRRGSALLPGDVTPGRFAATCPIIHLYFLKAGFVPQHSGFMPHVHLPIQSPHLAAVIPDGPSYDNMLYTSIIYCIYLDQIFNAAIGTGVPRYSEVEVILSSILSRRSSGMYTVEVKEKVLDELGLSTDCGLQNAKKWVDEVRTLKSNVAWQLLKVKIEGSMTEGHVWHLHDGHQPIVRAPFRGSSDRAEGAN